MRRFLVALFLLAPAAAALPAADAAAQDFPTRPVTLVVPWPAGGSTDRHLRVLAETTGKHLGQPVVIENKPGGAGTMGAATMAATAKPDGYTVAQVPVTVFRMPFIAKTSYDPAKDFTYIIHVTGYLLAVGVNADSQFKSWKDVLDYARANPGKFNYGHTGTGGTLHITMEAIARHAGIRWTPVPFKGDAELLPALLGDHIQLAASGTGMVALHEAGKVRVLNVWSSKRAKRLPDIPTLVELGHPIVSESPYGLAGPKGMDPKIVKILHDAFKKGMDDPAHLKVLEELDQPVIYMNSDDYTKFAMKEIGEQKEIINQLGLAKTQ